MTKDWRDELGSKKPKEKKKETEKELIPCPLIERRKLIRSGSSTILTVPKSWLEFNGLKRGDHVLMVCCDDLVFKKLTEKNVKELQDKVDKIKKEL